ncbi:hypothetical protein NQ317_017622 [Molorchus minor]|uniref:Uncharacterized protein n=1 Tax=Molorchus minor TaxID=1323400 RepID=A0ABQ9IT40_9CUCU|nr:hypothetical protein NQ317_017622 [Molorchus minor]
MDLLSLLRLDMMLAAAVVICDSSLETWITDCEDSITVPWMICRLEKQISPLAYSASRKMTIRSTDIVKNASRIERNITHYHDRKKERKVGPSNSKKKNDPPVKG